MWGSIGFGIVDNGVLILGAVLGFSFEDLINEGLARVPRYLIQTRVKGLSSALLGAGIGNAISDFLGGFCISLSMAFGTLIGCLFVVVACFPFIFKVEPKGAI